MPAVFTPISRREMEEFLGIPQPGEDNKTYPEGYAGFKPVTFAGTYELVYSKRVDPEKGKQLALRVYTGIEAFSGESREVGEDAIRVQLFARDDAGKVSHVGGSRRCHRVQGWRNNLQRRLDNWEEQIGPSCPKCGRMMAERDGSKGKFWGCPGYDKDAPDAPHSCKGTLPYSAKGSPECPCCDHPMAKRNGRNGEFWGCTQYPECKGTRDLDGNDTTFRPQAAKTQAPALPAHKCPLCNSNMRERQGKHGPFLGCVRYPDCKGIREVDGSVGKMQGGKTAPVQAAKTAAPPVARPQPPKTVAPAPVKPVAPAQAAKPAAKCPKCRSDLRLLTDSKGQFWSCSSPRCGFSADLA